METVCFHLPAQRLMNADGSDRLTMPRKAGTIKSESENQKHRQQAKISVNVKKMLVTEVTSDAHFY